MDPIVQDLRNISGVLVGDPDRGFWVLKLDSIDGISNVTDVKFFSNGNLLYVANYSLITINTNGEILNAKKLIGVTYEIGIINASITFDDSILYCGTQPRNTNNFAAIVGLLDNTFNMDVVWTKWYGAPTAAKYTYGYAVAPNPSDNGCLITGYGNLVNTLQTAFSLKLNSSGALVWIRNITYASSSTYGWSNVQDSVGNCYTLTERHLIKFSPTATVLWQKFLPYGNNFTKLVIDKNDNVFYNGYDSVYTALDSSGNIIGGGELFTSSNTFNLRSIYTEDLFLYATVTELSVPNQINIIKINLLTNTIVWFRKISNLVGLSDTDCFINGSGDNLYITCNGGFQTSFIIKYPKDGSVIGTYSHITITAITGVTLFSLTQPPATPVATPSNPTSLYANATVPTVATTTPTGIKKAF